MMRKCWTALIAALTAALVAPSAASAAQSQASVGAVSDYVVHGLTRSLGEPAVQGTLSVSADRGYTVGLWASTVDLYPGPGVSQEYALFVAHRHRINADLAIDVELSRYNFPKDRPTLSYDYTELRTALSFRDTFELAVSASPDSSAFSRYGPARERTALHAELAVHYPVSRHWSLTGGVGHADLSELVGAGYWYFSAGLELRWNRLSASVGLAGTDRTGEWLFGEGLAGRRFVGALVWQLR